MTPADDFDIGLTGARFGGAPRKRRRKKAEESAAGASGSGPGRRTADEADTAEIPVVSERVPPRPDRPVEDVDDEHGHDVRGRSLAVRPYFYTKGRTRSRYELAMETLVSTPPAALRRAELAEHLPILELCREPRSVAEVGAIMGMPLGVARVVVGDLAVTGGLEVHRTVTAEGPDLALMERVLSGLRRL
ncbi:DUF742 domain-containing protein [Pseudonocardia kujensis]|uniref:DUF742 domain-containing protein n=1 Tax=Pseudonocardia kujensis TaxID=1128675 RepID=UPI001E61969A|nr:DUF742 domain-containing protein [Pseudonocardia kujensis]MCE0762305.1 DUF742 domain-containing protein [Pseudonocardia kujensis]